MTRDEAEELLFREALLLDRRDWDAWLDLYLPDAVFWMPAWRDEDTPVEDPDTELSLIHYAGRRGIEERVWRVRSGQSVASAVLPRTSHMIGNVLVERSDAASAETTASFTVHQHDVRAGRSHVFFGRYDHRLRLTDAGWRIAAKRITLLNDMIPTVVDFYSV